MSAAPVTLRLSRRRVIFAALLAIVLGAVLIWGEFSIPLSILWALVFGAANLLELRLPSKVSTVAGRVLWAAGPLLALYLVELLNLNTLFEDVTALEMAMNLVWYYLLAVVLSLLTGRRNLSAKSAFLILVIIGNINHYIIHFRGRSIFPIDLLTLRTAANVAGSYSYQPCETQCLVLLIAAGFLTVLGWLPKEKGRKMVRWPISAGLGAAWAIYIALFAFSPMVEALGIEPSLWTTRGNGFILNFTVCLKYSTMEKPDGYSSEAAQELADEIQSADTETEEADSTDSSDSTTASASDVEPQNIIVIMDESFSELSVDGDLELSADDMPFIHSLTENTIKGHSVSSVFGGTTANSEYEFLTSNSMAFLPAGSVPYQLFVRPGDPSLVEQLSDLGYTTVALHPFKRSGWNRPVVYSDFGFDRIMFYDDFEDVSYVREYISDRSDFENLIRLYEEKEEGEKLFLFNVTMQNHSAYNQEWTNLEKSVSLAGRLEGTSGWANQYLSLVHETDSALEYLIDYFSQVEEPTIILFFGDHQPQLSTDFYSALMGKDVNDLTAEEALSRYKTVFVLWANYDIPEAEDVEISINYLSTLLLEQTSLPLTGYQTLLSELKDELPVISAAGYVTADGTFAEKAEELSEDLQEKVNDYAILQYNQIGDRKHRLENFFALETFQEDE